jgi:endonuclease YncB( thermonuclease family)
MAIPRVRQTVRVEVENKDRYGRTVGGVFASDVAVNVELVRRGFAWWYRTYAKKAADLAIAEPKRRTPGAGCGRRSSQKGASPR